MSLIQDPMRWSASMVSSWARFWAFGVFLVLAMVYAIYVASHDGWRSALGIAFFVAGFQVMTLYALRRLYQRAGGTDVTSSNDEFKRRHQIWFFVIVVATLIAFVFVLKLPNAV